MCLLTSNEKGEVRGFGKRKRAETQVSSDLLFLKVDLLESVIVPILRDVLSWGTSCRFKHERVCRVLARNSISLFWWPVEDCF